METRTDMYEMLPADAYEGLEPCLLWSCILSYII